MKRIIFFFLILILISGCINRSNYIKGENGVIIIENHSIKEINGFLNFSVGEKIKNENYSISIKSNDFQSYSFSVGSYDRVNITLNLFGYNQEYYIISPYKEGIYHIKVYNDYIRPPVY